MTDTAESQLRIFAQCYTAAWCSQNAESVAGFYSPHGSLRINDGSSAVGREAITEVAQEFMTAFPDLEVVMDRFSVKGVEATYHWTLTGTNTGPGGSGNRVHISGFEEWRIGDDGLIAESRGHFDDAQYEHQLENGRQPSNVRPTGS
jgi:hypothetical protein